MTNPSIQYRSFHPDLEVRSGGDGRTIYGIAVPFNAPMRITDNLVEQFARSSFNHQLAKPNRVKYAREHMALRTETQQRRGADFNLKAYHDQVLSYGSPPVRFARQMILDLPIE